MSSMPNKKPTILPKCLLPITIAIPPLKTRFDNVATMINLHPKGASMLFSSVIFAVDNVIASRSVRPGRKLYISTIKQDAVIL